MGATFDRVRELVKLDDWYGSDHALVRLEENSIDASELADRIDLGLVVEDYPGYYAGPCVLVLQEDGGGPVHALWGLKKGIGSMSTERKTKRLVREGSYIAEVDVTLIEESHEWAPFIPAADMRKMDKVRLALRRGDLAEAAKHARVYEMKPVAAE